VQRELTYNCMVNEPPGRVAAALAPLSSLDLEVVLGVDDRVDAAWVDGYRQLADRVLLVPFPGSFERIYPWLCEQCAGRWILHLAADEVPSAELAAEVAETIAADDVTHAWIPRRWLYPGADSYLAQWPWRPDYGPRLFRNDAELPRFPGQLHEPIRVAGPYRYLRAPIYHADLVLQDTEARERKCARYESERPGYFLTDGVPLNEAVYLPERRDDLRFAPVPTDDAPVIAAFLDPQPPSGPPRAPVERFGLDEVTRPTKYRSVSDADYEARLELLDDDLRLVAGERRAFDVEVTNLGTSDWPGGFDAHPQVRLGYRWIGADGERLEGGQTLIGSVVRIGESAIVPLEMVGPDEPGVHEVEIDLVHEFVRWFDCGVRASIEVRLPGSRSVRSPRGRPGRFALGFRSRRTVRGRRR
jgi:hypothetical protein